LGSLKTKKILRFPSTCHGQIAQLFFFEGTVNISLLFFLHGHTSFSIVTLGRVQGQKKKLRMLEAEWAMKATPCREGVHVQSSMNPYGSIAIKGIQGRADKTHDPVRNLKIYLTKSKRNVTLSNYNRKI
jgi:hypothetical protein